MKTRILATIVASVVVAVGCAPAVANPGTASVQVVVTDNPSVHAVHAKALTGIAWGVATWKWEGKPVITTAAATTTQARQAHTKVCSAYPTAVLFETANGNTYTATCPKPAAPTDPDTDIADSGVDQVGAVSFYEDRSVLAFPKYRNARGCAHKRLDAGTVIRLRYKGKSTTCVVDDRGPYIAGRIVDLQAKQFAELAPLSAGVIYGVEISY